MSYDGYLEEWAERYFGGNYEAFCREYDPDNDIDEEGWE